mmetsp:Transcript_82904/g.146398  ORF Transcript_82904/g.146398 Transcript_82904/m.146398 type:complete len:569 (+) Transcript_82904:51-1757(+)
MAREPVSFSFGGQSQSPSFGGGQGGNTTSFSGQTGQSFLPPSASFASTSTASVIVNADWEANASHCSICQSKFGLINRRHHCRKCGKCVCRACAPNFVQLQGQGTRRQRLCTPCIRQMTYGQSYLQRAEEAEAEVRRLRDERESFVATASFSAPAGQDTLSFGPPSSPRHRMESDQEFIVEASRQMQQQLEEKEKQLKDTETQAEQARRDLLQAKEVVYRLARGLNHIGSSTQGSTTPRGGPKAEIQFSNLDEALSVSEASFASISESLYQLRSAQQKVGAQTAETQRTNRRLKTVEMDVQKAKEAIVNLGLRLHQLAGEAVDSELYISDLKHALEYCDDALPKLEEVHLAAKLSAGKSAELDRRESEVDAKMMERQVSSTALDQEKLIVQEADLKRKAEDLQAEEADLRDVREEMRRQREEQEQVLQKQDERQRELDEQEQRLQEQMKELEAKRLEFEQGDSEAQDPQELPCDKSETDRGRAFSDVVWEENSSQCSICSSKIGRRNMTLSRRHHCRICGKCVCSTCSPSMIQFEAGQGLQRACTPCVLSTFSAPRTLSGSIHEGDDQ